MTYKQIEASREVRLWIKDIVVPVLGFVTAIVVTNPEVGEPIRRKVSNLKQSITKK